MRIVQLYGTGEDCNTYVLGEEGKPCVIVDPGNNENGSLDRYINKHHGYCLGYLITHGHCDHIAGLKSLEHRANVFMMAEDVACLNDPDLNVSRSLFGKDGLIIDNVVPYELDDEDEIKLGEWIFKVIATPFHTRGSCCFYVEAEKVLFSGDTLFHLGIGRSDLPGSCPRETAESLRKLAALPISTVVYPGHGERTSIKTELAFNDELRQMI
jgi:hydroxyacylglutathione hydrolase